MLCVFNTLHFLQNGKNIWFLGLEKSLFYSVLGISAITNEFHTARKWERTQPRFTFHVSSAWGSRWVHCFLDGFELNHFSVNITNLSELTWPAGGTGSEFILWFVKKLIQIAFYNVELKKLSPAFSKYSACGFPWI